MLHLRNEIFEHRVRDITHEQIAVGVFGRKQLVLFLLSLRHGYRRIGVSGTGGILRGFGYAVKPYSGYQVRTRQIRGFRSTESGYQVRSLRGFRYDTSRFQVQGFEILSANSKAWQGFSQA